jgi:hypothetical protein
VTYENRIKDVHLLAIKLLRKKNVPGVNREGKRLATETHRQNKQPSSPDMNPGVLEQLLK